MKALIVLALLTSAALAADDLTLADLQALEKQQAWTELLDKADRVKPAARTGDWTRLVRAAAAHVIEQIANDSADWRTAARLIEIVPAAEHRYSFLVGDKAYIDGKAKALARVASLCAREDIGGCGTYIEYLADGVTRFPKGTAREIALLLSEEQLPSLTVRFWALAADDDREVCQNGRLSRAVVNVLRGAGGDRAVPDAQRAAATCYADLEQVLVRELIAAKDASAYVKNACPVLKTHGAQTVLKKKKCP